MSTTRRWWIAPAVVYLATLAVFLAWSPASREQFPLDDAWIHRVYSRSFAFGHGFAYNDAQEAGFTSPLWVVISAPIQWLEPWLGTAAVVWGVKLLGAALGGLAVAAVYRLGRGLCRGADGADGPAWPAALAAALFACEPALMFSSLSGMEVTLLVCLWLWLVAAIHAERWRLAAVMLGLLPVARPEAIVLAALCVAVLAVQRRRAILALVTPWSLAWAIVPTAAWLAFCELATGHLLPNTYYLKTARDLDGLASLGTLIVAHGGAIAAIAGGAALAAWCAQPGHRRHAPIAALLALGSLGFVVAVVTTRAFLPLGYYWTRWTDPGVLGFGAACSLGIALGLHAVRARGLAVAGGIAVIAVALAMRAGGLGERAERLGSDGRVIERLNVEPGRWIAEHVPAGALVGVNDAGALRYFGGRTTIDIVGLNNADVAFGREPMHEIEGALDWLALYPGLVRGDPVLSRFQVEHVFAIPAAEYTICDCAGPTNMVVARRP